MAATANHLTNQELTQAIQEYARAHDMYASTVRNISDHRYAAARAFVEKYSPEQRAAMRAKRQQRSK